MIENLGSLLARLKLPSGSLTRADKVFIGIMALLPIVLIIAASLYFQREYMPPVVYSRIQYEPVNPDVCPGEMLEYHTEVEITKDADVFTIRSIREPIGAEEFGEGHRTVAQIGTTYASVDAGDMIGTDQSVLVPALPPGDYYLVVSTNSLAGRPVAPSRYRVRFNVPEYCPLDEPAETSGIW